MKRGSFLARGDEALAKLAQVIKQSDNALTSNHSKHFLFTHLSPSVDDSKGKVADTDAENLETDDQKVKQYFFLQKKLIYTEKKNSFQSILKIKIFS